MPTISDVESIKKALLTTHHGFPVVNTAGKIVGHIPQSMIVKLLKKKAFYKKERVDRGSIHRREMENEADSSVERAFTKRNSINAGVNASLITADDPNPVELPKKFSLDYDALNGFPETPKESIINWVEFNTNVNSDEVDASYVLENIVDNYAEEWLDLRPYMIENPIKVSVYAKMKDVLELFRMHHLRHLIVVNPNDGQLAGIVTRKDLFAYMGL